ncbi:putative F-box/kelch-repeat protein [Drosera capensis]
MVPRHSTLPTDAILEVLVCLPVKSLLRFKCVAKSWRDVITNPEFIKRHLNHAKQHTSSQNHIFVAGEEAWNGTTDLPCNFYSYNLDALHPPRVDLHLRFENVSFYMFGRAPQSGDYKVVRLVELWDRVLGRDAYDAVEVHIFSLKANSWKRANGTVFSGQNAPTALVRQTFVQEDADCVDNPKGIVSRFDLDNETSVDFMVPGQANGITHLVAIHDREGKGVYLLAKGLDCTQEKKAGKQKPEAQSIPRSDHQDEVRGVTAHAHASPRTLSGTQFRNLLISCIRRNEREIEVETITTATHIEL